MGLENGLFYCCHITRGIHTFQQFPITIFLLDKQCSVLALSVLTKVRDEVSEQLLFRNAGTSVFKVSNCEPCKNVPLRGHFSPELVY